MMALHGVVTSDWHLMGVTRFFPENHIKRQLDEIHKPFRYAIEHSIEHVFVLGDIADTPFIDEEVLISLITLLLSYDTVLNTYYLMGNHDFAQKGKTSMNVLRLLVKEKFFKRFQLFEHPKQKKIEGIWVNFMPWPHNDSTKMPEQVAALNLVHLEIAGALTDNGMQTKKGEYTCRPEDYTVSGHIHQYQELKKRRVLYVGGLAQKTFGEKLPKGFIDLQARMNKGLLRVNHSFVNSMPSWELRNIRIESKADWKKISDDPKFLYKVSVAEGVIVPTNIRELYPAIFDINGERKQVEEYVAENRADTVPKFSLTYRLNNYLTAQGLSTKHLSKARGMVKEALQELHLR